MSRGKKRRVKLLYSKKPTITTMMATEREVPHGKQRVYHTWQMFRQVIRWRHTYIVQSTHQKRTHKTRQYAPLVPKYITSNENISNEEFHTETSIFYCSQWSDEYMIAHTGNILVPEALQSTGSWTSTIWCIYHQGITKIMEVTVRHIVNLSGTTREKRTVQSYMSNI
jgi:hypothetical protein